MGILVGLVEAGYYTIAVGPSGDDYTGFLAGAAGLALLALSSVTFWRSRRPGGSRPRRYLRRVLLGILGIAFLTEVFLPFGISYMATHVYTAEVPEADLGAAPDDVTFTTSDGLEIEGWYVPSRNRAAVILPGRTSTQPHARMLIEHGYDASCSSTGAARVPARATRTCSAGAAAAHPRGRRLPPEPAGRRPRTDRWPGLPSGGSDASERCREHRPCRRGL